MNETHLLATRVHGRDLLAWVIDSEHWHVLDLPPLLRPDGVQADPAWVGYLDPRTR